MRVRLNKKLTKKKDGIDMALIYVRAKNIDLREFEDTRIKNSLARINFATSSEKHVSDLAEEYQFSKSETVRRCLKWLETQPHIA